MFHYLKYAVHWNLYINCTFYKCKSVLYEYVIHVFNIIESTRRLYPNCSELYKIGDTLKRKYERFSEEGEINFSDPLMSNQSLTPTTYKSIKLMYTQMERNLERKCQWSSEDSGDEFRWALDVQQITLVNNLHLQF